MTAAPARPSSQWNIAAAVAAWVVPGLGHFMLGQTRRAAILAVTIGLLWVGGLAIGGVSVIDRHDHTFWYVGQMLMAPSLAVNWYQAGHDPAPGPDAAYEPSFGRVEEQGILYTALAGMLNLLAILDVLYRDPADPRHRADADRADGAERGGA